MAAGKLFINGIQHHDGDPIEVGGEAPSQVSCNGVIVWVNKYAPNAPVLNSVTSGISKVTINFTNSTDPGVPVATYNLLENDIEVATNITSGYIRSVVAGTRSYKVRAINTVDYADSNSIDGISVQPSGSRTFTSSGTWVCPIGVTSVGLKMIGGGGSGALDAASIITGGGGGGSEVCTTVTVVPGTSYSMEVGSGALSKYWGSSAHDGENGGASTAFGHTAGGGRGGNSGTGSSYYHGNGESRSTCVGTSYNGVCGCPHYGGQAGWADGTNGHPTGGGPATAGVGAGGGGYERGKYSCGGGRGEIRLIW